MKVEFLYGKKAVSARFSGKELRAVLSSAINQYQSAETEAELVQSALSAPVDSPLLCELATGKKNIVIIASDHTRPVPSRLIMPAMLCEIRKGNPEAEITILIATGCHRETTREELIGKFGEELVENEHIVIHDCDDTANLVEIGTLPSGGKLIVNRLAAEADLLLAEGFIEPHFFAGYSGGRKSVLPGICSRQTVVYNHNAAFIADEHARTGILEQNPIHRDMCYAAEAIGLAFIVNVVLNAKHEVLYAVAGNPMKAHQAGVEFLSKQCLVRTKPCDIAISTNGGYPLDQNIYQAVKGMTAAEAAVKKGGIIIMLAKSTDGHGGENFYRMLANQEDEKALLEEFMATKPEETKPDQWQVQVLLRVLAHARVIFVSDAEPELVRKLHLIPEKSLSAAVKTAKKMLKEKGIHRPEICAIPDGVSVIVKQE